MGAWPTLSLPSIVFSSACKSPGGSCDTFKHGYAFTYTVTNNDDQTIYITAAEATCTSGSCPSALTWRKDPGQTYAVQPGESVDLVFVFTTTNSANRQFAGDVRFFWNHGAGDTHPDHTQPVIAPYRVAETPRGCACIVVD